MPSIATNKTSRLDARITPELRDQLRYVAARQGRSVSDFVVAAAQEAAQKTVTEIEIMRLSREAQEQFVALLLNPPKPAPALKRAFERHRAMFGE